MDARDPAAASGSPRAEDGARAFVESFDELHERVFAVHEPGQAVEITLLEGPAGRACRRSRRSGISPPRGHRPPRTRERPAYFPGVGAGRRDPIARGCRAGARAIGSTGPALIAEPTTTVVVPPGTALTVTELGNYLLEIE